MDIGSISRDNAPLPWTKLISNFDAEYEFLANNGTDFLFCTTLCAPRKRVISIDTKTMELKEIIPQHLTNVIVSIACVAHAYLVVEYMEDVKSKLQIFQLHSGNLVGDIPVDLGTIRSISCDQNSTDLFFKFQSFFNPGTIYHVDLQNLPKIVTTVHRRITAPGLIARDVKRFSG